MAEPHIDPVLKRPEMLLVVSALKATAEIRKIRRRVALEHLPQTDAVVKHVAALLDTIGIRGRDMKGNTDDKSLLANRNHPVHCKCPMCAWWQ